MNLPTHAVGFPSVRDFARIVGTFESVLRWGVLAGALGLLAPAPAAAQDVTVTSVSVSPGCPVSVGTTVTWTAVATGGVAPLEYRFWLYDETSRDWTLLQAYAVGRAVEWTPAAAGTYHVQVWVRESGSTASYEAWRNSESCTVTAPAPPTIVSVTAESASPVVVGTPAMWTVVATAGVAPLQYRFWLRNETAGTWTLLQDYTEANTAPWTPATSGGYFVQAWVRSAGSSADWEAWRNSEVVEVGRPTPPPKAPEWTVVVTTGGDHVISWAPEPGADRYRIYWASSEHPLMGVVPTAVDFTEVEAPQFIRPVADPSSPVYYRVFSMLGPRMGTGGPVAVSTTMEVETVPLDSPWVSAALWDVDDDGCLDMVGAQGTCDGRFEAYPIEGAGLGGLFAGGRVNRDSRFADFTGDGITDIFTNVYSRADDPLSTAVLHVGNGDGTFTVDPAVAAMGIGGFGETVLAADFDNDGDVDIFIPNYWDRHDGGHNWLLINDGAGHFTDVAAAAGVATCAPNTPEGAEAIDFNQDGWVDIVVASHLYINNGDLTFTDQAATAALPQRFDEGMALFDLDMDGDFDLVHHDGFVTRLYTNEGGTFDGGLIVDGSPDQTTFGYGLTVCDINGDGFEDVLVAHNSRLDVVGQPHLLINVGGTLVKSDFVSASPAYNDLVACADLDHSGLPDVLTRWNGYRSLINRATSDATIRLRVLGSDGQRNQQGRIVRLQPEGAARTLLRAVESGSGYMAQGGYDLLVAAPWPGWYEVHVRFAGGWVSAIARAGDELTIYADGRVATGLQTVSR